MNTALSIPGLACSVMASILFGIAPWYIQQLGMDGYSVFWNRIIFTALILAFIVLACRQWNKVTEAFKSVKVLLLLTLGALLAGIQWWLFVWAPLQGQTKELSLGYFLLPLTLVLTGKVVYGESISRNQQFALFLAIQGVLIEVFKYGSLSWVTMAVAGLYPFYFIVRKKAAISPLAGNFIETLIYLPAGIGILLLSDGLTKAPLSSWQGWAMLIGLGGLFAASMLFYLMASSRLSITLFGLLGYLEPAVLFLIAVFVFHEPFSSDQYLSYGLIWGAVGLTCAESIIAIRNQAASNNP
ncbi:EamA family transporter RarD [Spongorhabdus nitratireducens]